MKAYVFPGQGAQFVGMGKDLYDNSPEARALFEKANELLGFRITDAMFSGTDEELKQTRVTQPAIFLHSVLLAKTMGEAFQPDMVAGHSLGEFSALVAANALSFEDGLLLVSKRALAMQKACEAEPSTMAAILGVEAGGLSYSGWVIRDNIFQSCVTAININGRACTITGNTIAEYGINAAGAIAAVLALGIDLSGTSSGANCVWNNQLGGTYNATLYKVGASGDQWAGNRNVISGGTTAANPS